MTVVTIKKIPTQWQDVYILLLALYEAYAYNKEPIVYDMMQNLRLKATRIFEVWASNNT